MKREVRTAFNKCKDRGCNGWCYNACFEAGFEAGEKSVKPTIETRQQHKEWKQHKMDRKHYLRHKELHEYLDEITADFLQHNPCKLLSNTSVMELLGWSSVQIVPFKKAGRKYCS